MSPAWVRSGSEPTDLKLDEHTGKKCCRYVFTLTQIAINCNTLVFACRVLSMRIPRPESRIYSNFPSCIQIEFMPLCEYMEQFNSDQNDVMDNGGDRTTRISQALGSHSVVRLSAEKVRIDPISLLSLAGTVNQLNQQVLSPATETNADIDQRSE